VLLLERSAEPHHKVCGEFLGPGTIACLGRLGIDLGGLGAAPIGEVTVAAGQAYGTARLPFRALSLSRMQLDSAILRRAAEAGADVRRGVLVQSAEPTSIGWQLRCSDGTEIECRSVVLATGKRPLRGTADQRDGSMVGLKIHLALSAAHRRALTERVELALFDRGYVGLELVEDDIANLCLILPRDTVGGIGRIWPALRDFLACAAPVLAGRLTDATSLWAKPLAVVCPNGAHLWRRPLPHLPGLYPIGDRLAHMPPFAGDGLAIALTSAEMAARHVLLRSPPEAYLAEARRATAPALLLAAITSRLATGKLGRAIAARTAAYSPAVLQMLARRTRVSNSGFATPEMT
jgi:flavin-dependent dehydrogenase